MGVDIGTYRCRIGQFRQRNGIQVVQITITCNFTGSLKMIGSVIFIGTLLIMAGIEPNPGPLPDEKSMAGIKPNPGSLPDKGDSTKQGQKQNHKSQQLDRTVARGSDFLKCFQKIWIENIYPETSHAELTNFIKENTTQDVSSLVFEEMYKETAIVSFENMIDTDDIKKIERNELNGRKLKCHQFPYFGKETESKKDKEEYTGCTIRFCNKKNVFNEELLMLYFANNRLTGGGPNFVEIDETSDMVFITFDNRTTAETVLKKTTHYLFDVEIHISLYVAGLNEDKNKILIENIDPKIDEELLVNFIEARTKRDVSDIRILKDKEIAILTFKDDIDFQVMKTQIESRKLKGWTLVCKPETNIPESFESRENEDTETTKLEIAEKTHRQVLHKFQLENYFPGKITLQDLMQITGEHQNIKMSDIPWVILRKFIMLDFRARDIHLSQYMKQVSQSNKLNSPTGSQKQSQRYVEKSEAINPLDFFLLLFSCCDHSLQQTLFQKLYTCRLAIPFCYQYTEKLTKSLHYPLWCIRGLDIEFFAKDGSSNVSTYDLQMNIIAFIRLNRPTISKSRYLNLVLNEEPHQTFLDNDCPFGKSKKILSDGLIEAAWFLPSGKSTQFLSKLIMFLNLRGNAIECKKQLKLLTDISCKVVIFIDIEDLRGEYLELLKQIHQSNVSVIHVLTSKDSNSNQEQCILEFEKIIKKTNKTLNELSIVHVAEDKTAFDIKNEIRISIEDCLDDKPRKSLSFVTSKIQQLGIVCDEDLDNCVKGKELAVKLMSVVQDVSIKKLKERTVPTQVNYWENYTNLLKKKNKSSESVNKTANIESRMNDALQKVAINARFTPFMQLFTEVILNENVDSLTISYFIQWLKYFINDRSKKQLPALREKYHKAWQEVKQSEESNNKANIEQCKKLAHTAERELAQASFGFEHIVREIGHFFEVAYLSSIKDFNTLENKEINQYAKVIAKLLISGEAVEIMDGDTASVSVNWVKAVINETIKEIGNVKVMTLSIIGIQSSGKSTLLNTMFGLKFPVSAGRCTRGIYMQLIKVHASCHLKNVQYILIIDAEGLRAPELAEQKSDHDNELATFVIGLGDITIVNIKGENYAEMQNILQIVVHAFIRLKLANKSLNLNKACAFIHQNVSSVNAAMQLKQSQQTIVDLLNKMAVEAAAQENISDIFLFKHVINFDHENHTWYFSDLWRGDPPMAPTNTGYSENCETVKNCLVKDFMQRKMYSSLKDVMQHIVDLWNGILGENFVFGFRNSLEVKAYNEMETFYMGLVWDHEFSLTEWLRRQLLECNRFDTNNSLMIFLDKVKNECGKVGNHQKVYFTKKFEDFFESHQLLDISLQWKEIKINDFELRTTDLINRTLKQISSIVSQKKLDLKTRKTQSSHQNQINEKAEVLAAGVKKLPEEKLEEIFNEMFKDWLKELQEERITYEPVLKSITSNLENNLSYSSILTSMLKSYPLQRKVQYPNLEGSINVNDIEDEFISTKTFWNKLKQKFKPKEEPKQRFVDVANAIFHKIDMKLYQYMKTDTKFQSSFVTEILQILELGIKEHSNEKKESFTITTNGRIFLILQTFRFARSIFEKLNAIFEEKYGITSRAEQYKKKAWTLFKAIVEQKSEEEILTSQFLECIEDPIMEQITESIPNYVVKKMVFEIYAKSKHELMYHILDQLAREEDFWSYVRYISDSYSFALKRVTEKTDFILFDSKQMQYRKLAKDQIQLIITDLKKCISDASEKDRRDFTVSDWLQDVTKHLKELVFPSTTFDNLLNRGKVDFCNIKKLLLKKIDLLEKKLVLHFESVTSGNIKWKSPTPYESVMDRIWGCKKQCPFCKEPCTKTDANHYETGEAHSCIQHRPIGITGVYREYTNLLEIESCNFKVQSKNWTFSCNEKWHEECKKCNPNDKEKQHYCSEYKKYFPEWDIPPSPNMESSTYWKWFVCTFEEKLLKFYEQNMPEIPSTWRTINKEKALESLRSVYS